MSENETKEESLLAGSTSQVEDGTTFSPNMKHGDESPAMLLALLNSPLESMIDSQQAKVLGTCMTKKGVGTILLVYGALPTPEGNRLVVGNGLGLLADGVDWKQK